MGQISDGSDLVCFGFDGHITRVRFQNNSIDPNEAKKIYDKGIGAHGSTGLDQYGVKVKFLKNNQELSSVKF